MLVLGSDFHNFPLQCQIAVFHGFLQKAPEDQFAGNTMREEFIETTSYSQKILWALLVHHELGSVANERLPVR